MMVSRQIIAVLVLAVMELRADQTAARTNCTLEDKRLKCKLSLPNSTEFSYSKLQWYQRYNNENDTIGITPVVPYTTGQQFVMWIQNFDDQTEIFAVLKSTNLTSRTLMPYSISVENKKSHLNGEKITYSESAPANFTCKNNGTQVGWIDPTGNRITTYRKANHVQKFNREVNGSYFCCLRYVIQQDFIISRFIEDIYILIYEEPSNQHTTTNPIPEQSTPKSTSTTTLTPSSEKSPRPGVHESTPTENPLHKPNQNNTVQTEKPKPSDNLEDPQKTDHLNSSPSDKKKYYVIIVSVAGAILVASLVYVIVKKCSRKGSDPEVTLQLEETYATTDMVYAELDMNPSDGPAPATTEETPYAEIIGVLRPVTENDKK